MSKRIRETAAKYKARPRNSKEREEAIAIVEAGIAGRPDLPTGKEFVRQVREEWRGPAGSGSYVSLH